jgi:hypothetical protein
MLLRSLRSFDSLKLLLWINQYCKKLPYDANTSMSKEESDQGNGQTTRAVRLTDGFAHPMLSSRLLSLTYHRTLIVVCIFIIKNGRKGILRRFKRSCIVSYNETEQPRWAMLHYWSQTNYIRHIYSDNRANAPWRAPIFD